MATAAIPNVWHGLFARSGTPSASKLYRWIGGHVADDLVEKIYGRAGGHAATDENAVVQAFRPELIKKEFYSDEMVYLQPPGFSVYPNPGTILSYKEGAGFLDFDQKKAEQFFNAVTERIKTHILDIFKRWERL